MSDDDILNKGGTEEDIKQYSIQNGAYYDEPDEIDEILLPHFGSWENKGDTFYFNTNANEIARNKVKQQLLALKQKWEKEAYSKGWADACIEPITNGDK